MVKNTNKVKTYQQFVHTTHKQQNAKFFNFVLICAHLIMAKTADSIVDSDFALKVTSTLRLITKFEIKSNSEI